MVIKIQTFHSFSPLLCPILSAAVYTEFPHPLPLVLQEGHPFETPAAGTSGTMQASKGSPFALIPKYSLMGPFKGHMSLKSSPFFPGSSCKLSTQYLIQDHMATHYKKMLSAKAAVDSTEPRSLHTSIKYKDQKKKEQLIAAVEKYKKEIQKIRSASPTSLRWSLNEIDHHLLAHTGGEPIGTQVEQHATSLKMLSRTSSPVLIAQDAVQAIVLRSMSPSLHRSRPRTLVPTSSLYLKAMQRANSWRAKKPFQDHRSKTYSGDLLEKHSNSFTAAEEPFTPRTLKKSAKSALSKYKYYNAPKKNMLPASRVLEEYLSESMETYRSLIDMYLQDEEVHHHHHHTEPKKARRETLPQQQHNSRHSQLQEKEEELKYLQFLREVTEDILMKGACSDKGINDAVQAQFQRRRYDLDEAKMKHYLRELNDDLTNSNKLDHSISYTGF